MTQNWIKKLNQTFLYSNGIKYNRLNDIPESYGSVNLKHCFSIHVEHNLTKVKTEMCVKLNTTQ